MFGYIKTYKPEMKFCEYDVYKAVYCTICKQLRKDYGLFARFTLSYDCTFLVMLRMATQNTCVEFKKGRCPFNPFVKCNRIHCNDTSLVYACAVAMFMVYYKWKDTLDDEGFFTKLGAWFVAPFVKRWYKKAGKKFPELKEPFFSYYENQKQAEKNPNSSFDAVAHPTAHMLGYLFSYGVPEGVSQNLYTIGYNLGKWVYLIDAFDDYSKDLKHKKFNPYVLRLGEYSTKEERICFATSQMNICMDEACMAFDKLPKGSFHSILCNVLFLGLEKQMNQIVKRVNDHE